MTMVKDRFGRTFFDEIAEWLSENTNPDDIFSDRDLEYWAETNGYVKEDECDN